jgi:hypothetical protein
MIVIVSIAAVSNYERHSFSVCGADYIVAPSTYSPSTGRIYKPTPRPLLLLFFFFFSTQKCFLREKKY